MPPTEEDIAWFKSTFHPIPKAALPDDCIEYSIHVISASLDTTNDSERRHRLREVQKYSTELQKQWLKDYIWQRQGFALEVQKEDGEVCMPTRRTITNELTSLSGVSLLRGRTEYGDSIEDEWVIVWLLRELSKKFNDAWIKVSDNDGEFLLIEASGSLPSWLEPDVAENRVWINNGELQIIKPANASKPSKRTEEKLSVQDARSVLLHEPKRMLHSISMENEAFYRLRNYPAQIKANMHHAMVTIPRKIAFLVHQKPSYITSAIEAFYLRDPIGLKPLNSKEAAKSMTFPPTDLATMTVRFPKVGYAQLKSQDFPPPAVFRDTMPLKTGTKLDARADSGMKITCGFEMLLSDSQHQDKPAVREMKMLLDDLATADESLPSNADIEKWPKQEDDETWLDIDFADLERELDGNKGKSGSDEKRGFGDRAAQENLQRIVKQFEDFLGDDKAGPDGAGLFGEDSDEDDEDEQEADEDGEESGDDEKASFDEDEFSKMMQEMMGMPSEVMREMMIGNLGKGAKISQSPSVIKDPDDRVQEMEADSSEGEEDMEKIMQQMGAELREHGALTLDPSSGKSEEIKRAIRGTDEESDSSEDDANGVNDIDVNLARNLLESFKAQSGTAGPGGNMMGLMGLNLPRDQEDGKDAAGPSKGKSKK